MLLLVTVYCLLTGCQRASTGQTLGLHVNVLSMNAPTRRCCCSTDALRRSLLPMLLTAVSIHVLAPILEATFRFAALQHC